MKATPVETSRYAFPSLGEAFFSTAKGGSFVPEFGVFFPHDKHADNDCADCHQTYQPQGKSDDEFVTKPPKNIGDAFWLKKGTLKTRPLTHASCFTCHNQESELAPLPQNCGACHKQSAAEKLTTDFDEKLATTIGVTDWWTLTAWRNRISAGAFRHEVHTDLKCAQCHNVTVMNTTSDATKKVPVKSCGGAEGCHVTATLDEGGILNYEIGAVSLEKIKEKSTKTPDFIVSWSDGKSVDVEVTCARAKATHIERRQIATNIAEQLHNQNSDRIWDLIVHYINPPGEELPRLMKTAHDLKPGLFAEKTGEWHVSAKMPDRDPYTLFTAGQRDELPKWWPTDTVAPLVFFGAVAGPNATTPPPQIRITYGVPFNAYVNPVQNKAENPQGGAANPFLIAIDVTELPEAFSTFKRELPKFLGLWKSVSGVMTFRSFTDPAKIGWLWQLIPNPHASALLPSELLEHANAENVLETSVLLMSRQ